VPAVADLTPSQLARHAFNVFLFQGRHVEGARLAYHALALDPWQPEALRRLSDLMDTEGTEAFSAAVLEHALAPGSPITGDDRETLDDLLFLSKWSWGFARHRSGEQHLDGDAFRDRTQFTPDEGIYQEFLQGVVGHAGSLGGAFAAAWTLCGVMGKLLTHVELGTGASIGEVYHPDRFRRADGYAAWLATDTEDLDALERERQPSHLNDRQYRTDSNGACATCRAIESFPSTRSRADWA
jgi:hypothetical protein